MNSPAWLERNEYPFESHWFNLPEGQMHYLGEGRADDPERETLLFVHGTPEWSFGYRKLIKDLAQDYRCLAPDLLGFGLSDKPEVSYHPKDQAERLGRFLETHDPGPLTLVLHDFGGPIGLGWALQHLEQVRRLVLMNT